MDKKEALEIVLEAIKEDGAALAYADKSLKKDRKFILEAVKRNGLVLQYADDSLKKDREIVLEALKQDGRALEYVDDSLKKDKEIVLEALKQNDAALEYVDDSLKKDPDFIMEHPFSRDTEIGLWETQDYFNKISSDLKYIPIYREYYERNQGDEFSDDIYSFEFGYVNSKKSKKSFLMFHDEYDNEWAPGNSENYQVVIKKFKDIKKKEINEFPKFIYKNYKKFAYNSPSDAPDLLNEVSLNKRFKWDIKKIEELLKKKLKNNKKVYNYFIKKEGFAKVLTEFGDFDESFLIKIKEFDKDLNENSEEKIIKILNPLTKVDKLKLEKYIDNLSEI